MIRAVPVSIPAPALGFLSKNNVQLEAYAKEKAAYDKKMNPDQDVNKLKADYISFACHDDKMAKIRGYIPIIGMFFGLSRIINANKSTHEYFYNRTNQVIRGVIELLGLGLLLLIPDLIVTCSRNCGKAPINKRVLNSHPKKHSLARSAASMSSSAYGSSSTARLSSGTYTGGEASTSRKHIWNGSCYSNVN